MHFTRNGGEKIRKKSKRASPLKVKEVKPKRSGKTRVSLKMAEDIAHKNLGLT